MTAIRWQCAVLLGLFLTGISGMASWANDSSAELTFGGLKFSKNDDVSMLSEELSISPANVSVRYRFLNNSAAPVTLTVAFPVPDIDLGDPNANYAFPTNDTVNFVGFQTKVDGQPITFNVTQRAMLGETDVSPAVKAAGLPFLLIGSDDKLRGLAEPLRKKLIDQGLLIPAGSDPNGKQLNQPGWSVRTAFVRQQTFPPGKEVAVEHTYQPSVGVGLDTVLRKGLRDKKELRAEVQRYRTSYCVNDEFLKSLDALAGNDPKAVNLQESRIVYILKTGANWAGPIKDFRLVVDSGGADRLLAFCGSDLHKLSPTSVEMRKKDFLPDRDLKILVVSKFK